MKDPAFLFYSQDFYSGTRLMLPIERACYIDLLIYQHQNRYIPLELDRVLMFCSSICLTTLEAVLELKFKKDKNGWYNARLKEEMDKRKKHNPYKIASATLGGLISSKNLTNKQVNFVKDKFKISDFSNLETNKDIKISVSEWLSKCLTIYEDDYENKDSIIFSYNIMYEKIKNELIIPDKFDDVIMEWLKYKSELKQSYKQTGLKQFIKKLIKLSNNNDETAQQITEQSMANNWAGIFDLKTNTNGETKRKDEGFKKEFFIHRAEG